MPELPGANLPAPALPNTQPAAPPPYPAWWSDEGTVLARCLEIGAIDPVTGNDMWRTYRRLTAPRS